MVRFFRSVSCVYVLIQVCPTLCNPMDCSPPGSSVHGTSQARTLERVAVSYSRRSSRPRDWTHASCVSCIDMWIFSSGLSHRADKSPMTCHLFCFKHHPFLSWVPTASILSPSVMCSCRFEETFWATKNYLRDPKFLIRHRLWTTFLHDTSELGGLSPISSA